MRYQSSHPALVGGRRYNYVHGQGHVLVRPTPDYVTQVTLALILGLWLSRAVMSASHALARLRRNI